MLERVTKLSEWVLLPREVRVAHCDLSTPCKCVEKTASGFYTRPKNCPLLLTLALQDDLPNWSTAGVVRSHLCPHDSKNGWCRNPLHYYFATRTENAKTDAPDGVGYNKGKAVLKNPETGEVALLFVQEAKEKGWVGVRSGVPASNRRPVEVTTPSGDRFVFPSVLLAAKELQLGKTGLGAVCRGLRAHHKNHTARYL